jgi:hypothetical protein
MAAEEDNFHLALKLTRLVLKHENAILGATADIVPATVSSVAECVGMGETVGNLVHLVRTGDSVEPLRRTESHLPQFSRKRTLGASGYRCESTGDASRPSLDRERRILCQLTKLHQCNCRLSMNGN